MRGDNFKPHYTIQVLLTVGNDALNIGNIGSNPMPVAIIEMPYKGSESHVERR